MTDLIIAAAAMVQRAEIEEELLKIRLKQRCFIALASESPKSVFQQAGETPALPDSHPTTLGANEFNHYPKGRW